MLIKVIKQYLTTERRLVVPRLGVFLVKEDHTIAFSELMRRDDGVLRRLLVEAGMNELAAVGAIDRLIFEVHQAIEEGSSYTLEGFGRFSGGPNDTICFKYDLQATLAQHPTVAQQAAVPEPRVADPEPVKEEVITPVEEKITTLSDEPLQSEAESEPSETEVFGEQTIEEQIDDAFEETDLDEDEDEDAYAFGRRHTRRKSQASSRKPDRFVLVALIAVVLALAAIAFGYYREWSEAKAAEESVQQIEQALNAQTENGVATDAPTEQTQTAK